MRSKYYAGKMSSGAVHQVVIANHRADLQHEPVEPVSVVLSVRDRVSTTVDSLSALFDNSPPLDQVSIVVDPTMPPQVLDAVERRFGHRVILREVDHPVSQAEARSIGLGYVDTELCVTMDVDAMVRPGWLEPLVARLRESSAAVVTPLILEADTVIHAAGNDFYVHERDGKLWGHKVLRFNNVPFNGSSSLRASTVDYAEYHCLLVDVAKVRAAGAFDPSLSHEVHTGLLLKEAGHEVWIEPDSVVMFDLQGPLRLEDLGSFRRFFDVDGYRQRFDEFERRWGIDVTEEGRFLTFIKQQRDLIPWLADLVPTPLGFRVGKLAMEAGRLPGRAGRWARWRVREQRHSAARKAWGQDTNAVRERWS